MSPPSYMKATLSPKEMAQAIGVSESSVKRWVDDGQIEATRTSGGHRRIAVPEAVRFVREEDYPLLRPDLLGLADLSKREPDVPWRRPTADALFEALSEGKAAAARDMMVHSYIDGESLPALCDGPIHEAVTRLGEIWQHDARGIFIEHRATDICLQALNQIRGLLPTPPASAPVAVGGCPAGDTHALGTLMAATVLADAGYRVVHVGPDTPLDSFRHAVEAHKPDLLWLAFSNVVANDPSDEEVMAFGRELAEQNVAYLAGGSALAVRDLSGPGAPQPIESMAHLVEVAREHRGTDSEAAD
ncbi:MAG: cobalamin-dependent protein [Phycisphaeraceae bacterium]|nr:cobalamin-dependent protein [Phycisphaeraceae bacterium]